MFTQGRVPADVRAQWDDAATDGWPVGWLVRRHELHTRRGGFGGTIAALTRPFAGIDTVNGELKPRVNHSSGAGAVVRAAPIGLLLRPDKAFNVAVRNAGLTHGGADAYLGAGFVALVTSQLIAGVALPRALETARTELARWPHNSGILPAVDAGLAGRMPAEPLSHGARALYVAVEAIDKGRSLLDLLSNVAVAGGTAAMVVAGSMWGAVHGARQIPAVARSAVDVVSVIEELSDATSLWHRAWVLGEDIGPPSVQDGTVAAHLLWTRFPGW